MVGVLDKRASLCPTPKTLHPETAQHPPVKTENHSTKTVRAYACVRNSPDITIEKCSRCAISRRTSLCPTPKTFHPETSPQPPPKTPPKPTCAKCCGGQEKTAPGTLFPCSGSTVCARLHHVRGNSKVMASNYPQMHPNTHSSKHKGPRSVAVVVAVAVVDAVPCAANILEQARWETSNPRYVRTLGNVC